MSKCQDLVIPYDEQTGVRIEEIEAALNSMARSPQPCFSAVLCPAESQRVALFLPKDSSMPLSRTERKYKCM